MKKILIIQTAFIGDVILATSLVKEAKMAFPDAQLDFLLRKGNEGLLEYSPHINHIYIWDKKRKYSSLLENLKLIRKQNYDAVINIQRFFNSGLITALSGAKTKIGFDKNPLSFCFHHSITHLIPDVSNGKPLHEVQRNSKLIRPLSKTLGQEATRPELFFSEKEIESIKELNLPEDYIVIAPSSVWFTKQWAHNKWQELISTLCPKFTVYLIGAPSDSEFIEPLVTENVVNLCGKLSLLESALLMKNATRVFVNDSAPLHLASAVNAKTTAIFCSTVPEFGYFPLSVDSQLIQLAPRLACMPCGLHGKKACPLGHFKCAHNIPVSQVAATIQ